MLNFRSQGIWIDEDVLKGLTEIRLEEWSTAEGNSKIEQAGGSVKVGDDYSSNFLVVYPMKPLVKSGRSFTLKMKLEESTGFKTYIYHSSDMKTWSAVSDVSYKDGTATFQGTSGKIPIFNAVLTVSLFKSNSSPFHSTVFSIK